MSSNIVFWLVAVALLVATIAAVTWPLLRGRRDSDGSAADSELDSTRHELAQLEARRASGEVSQDEYAQQKQALAVRLLDQIAAPGAATTAAAAAKIEASATTSAATASASKSEIAPKDAVAAIPKAGRNRWLAPAAAAFVIVLCAVFYALLGLPGTARHPSVASSEESQVEGDSAGKGGNVSLSQQQIQRMVDEMTEEVKNNPKDAAAWSMLAHSYDMMRKFDEASKAYAKATQLLDNNAQLWADYADSLAMAQGRTLDGEPMKLINKALALDGNNTKALALAGSNAFDHKDFAGAISYWEKAAKSSTDAQFTQQLQSGITEAKALRQGISPDALAQAAPAAEKSAPAAKSGPAATSSAGSSAAGATTGGSPAGSATEAAGKSTISGRVSLAPALKSQASPDDTVFIFARAPSGPRMPLAMMRRQVRDLPIDFNLDDSQSMMPGLTLSQHKTVIIGARISKRGDAMAQPGDLQGLTSPIAVGSSGIKLEISEVVK